MRQAVKILLAIFFCMFALQANGKGKGATLRPSVLMISNSEISGNTGISADILKVICANLGKKLTIKDGAFGLGVFTSAKCSVSTPAVGENFFWMKIRTDKDQMVFEVGLVTSANPFRRLAEVRIPKTGKLKELMEVESLGALMAFSLLEQMPFQKVYTTTNPKLEKHSFSDIEKELIKSGIVVPATMIAFSASVDSNGLIFPNIIGKIKALNSKGKKRRLHDTGVRADFVTWTLDAKTKKLPASVFGLQAGGRSQSKEKMQALITVNARRLIDEINQGVLLKGAKAVSSMVGSIGSAGYLGLRYGPALLEGDLIDQSKYFGALVEFRSGWMDGIRLYYDYWPEVKGTINNQDGTFGGKRAILAYSLALKFDFWIQKIDLTPKIGVWSFKSKAPIELEPGVYVSPEFEIKSSPSFDIELGIETGSSVHILRGWASTAASFLKSSSRDAKIQSTRVGMDLLLSPWGSKSSVTVSLLSFGFYEAVQLKKSQKIEGEDAELDQLNYSQAYAGGGVAISW